MSGLSGDATTAQSQVSVGMGLLAGSTVMLLTVIWGTCTVVGKCDLRDTIAVNNQDTKGFHLNGNKEVSYTFSIPRLYGFITDEHTESEMQYSICALPYAGSLLEFYFMCVDSGVTVDVWTSYAARIMAISVIPFVIVQLPQMLGSTSGRQLSVLVALVLSVLMLISYCVYQVT